MKKAKSAIKASKVKSSENKDYNNIPSDEDSSMKTMNIFNSEKKERKEENNKELIVKNEKNDFLEKLYINVVQIFENNINKIANVNDKVVLPKSSSLEDLINI